MQKLSVSVRVPLDEEDSALLSALVAAVADRNDFAEGRVFVMATPVLPEGPPPGIGFWECGWLPCSEPPSGAAGCWSRRVVVLMRSGDVFRLSYFRGDVSGSDEGRWQRPKRMQSGDVPEWWIDAPTFFEPFEEKEEDR